MNVKSKLKNVIEIIENAQTKLKRAKKKTEDDLEIRRALTELEEAKNEIYNAIRNLPKEE